jgi:hypothetical protein
VKLPHIFHSDPHWQERGVWRYHECCCGARRVMQATRNLMGPVDPGWPQPFDHHGVFTGDSGWQRMENHPMTPSDRGPSPRRPLPDEQRAMHMETAIVVGALDNFIRDVRADDQIDPQYSVDARHIRQRLIDGELVLRAAGLLGEDAGLLRAALEDAEATLEGCSDGADPLPIATTLREGAARARAALARSAAADGPTAQTDGVHVVSVVYDFDGRSFHTCLRCHYAGFSPPPLPCRGPLAAEPVPGSDQ